jgi:hypothetical protein
LLGVSRETDVFELQIWDPATAIPVQGEQAIASVAVALRRALVERIGIEEREIGWGTVPARLESTGAMARSLVLYDTACGGAGFVARASDELPRLLRRARKVLQCPRECDKACHACLLAYDTQHSINKLDRHQALAVLTEAFVEGLELPDELRVFGQDTQLEFANLVDALVREMNHSATHRARFYLSQDHDEWELELWALAPLVRRWAANGVEIELGLRRECRSRLSLEDKNLLASWIDSGLISVFESSADSDEIDGAPVVAEIGGSGRLIRFALPSGNIPAPNGDWVEAIEKLPIVRGVSNDSINKLTQCIGPSDLREAPKGSLSSIEIRSQLDGKIDHFGDRFLRLVSAEAPLFASRLAEGVQARRIQYQDRYLFSPLTARLFLEVCRGLAAKGVIGENSLVEIDTLYAERDGRRPSEWIGDNWPQATDRKAIFQGAMAQLDMKCEFNELVRRDLAHRRELSITWDDGAVWRIRFDEGLGFVEAKTPIPFDFNLPLEGQARALLRDRFDMKGRTVTHLYVFDIQSPD